MKMKDNKHNLRRKTSKKNKLSSRWNFARDLHQCYSHSREIRFS